MNTQAIKTNQAALDAARIYGVGISNADMGNQAPAKAASKDYPFPAPARSIAQDAARFYGVGIDNYLR